jgi:hypothetical protein
MPSFEKLSGRGKDAGRGKKKESHAIRKTTARWVGIIASEVHLEKLRRIE